MAPGRSRRASCGADPAEVVRRASTMAWRFARVRELKMQNLDVSTVVFAVVAIFVIFKLRSVLGTRTGAERRPLDPTAPPRDPGANGNVVSIGTVARAGGPPPLADRWKGIAEKGSPLAAALDAILAAERSFPAGRFRF